MMKISNITAVLLCITVTLVTNAFTVKPVFPAKTNSQIAPISKIQLLAVSNKFLSLELEKPLGMLLEENEENEAKGVKVEELVETGSAYASEYKDQLVGLKIAKVNGENVLNIGFDDVMERIIDSPSPVAIDFELELASSDLEASGDSEDPSVPVYDIGQTVTIRVIQEGSETKDIAAKVGNNLRKTLLENKVEVYRGLKKKLGNCGGSGTCAFCAVDFVDSEGWEKRSDYEEKRIGKYPTARLACMNNIQGPATIRVE
eukprot:CAMPEP_0197833286 /NCGR_PEP_ID=MMETSP1437-20131217/18513_1 /TAXON_ID=49252 ORGANISM="Eucampia antarctica, Strain CCMP1452" /NCGR_SAMPLE_ID=MMETSP1437 /ASSEMBLY_ACC=CAM_ASM_001096 /LENGTH=258 /DNA_ID=CAMNT_0043437251 /DNA_START=19 /DNA_END=795 /DNA_ORIENTATION=+